MISDPESVEKSLEKMPEGPRKEDIKRRLAYQKEVNYASKLIKIAEGNIESSKILEKAKKYPDSVSLLQQSVEKTAKAFFVLTEAVVSNQIKSISHYPSKKHQKEVKANMKKATNLKEAIEKNPELKNIPMLNKLDLKGFQEKAETANKIFDSVNKGKVVYSENIEILNHNIKEMDNFLSQAEEFEEKKLDDLEEEKLANVWRDNIKAVSKIRREKGDPIDEAEEKKALEISHGFIKHLAVREAKSQIYGGIANAINSTLNLFMSPHFSFSRYPDEKNPLEYYNEKNPLVQKLSELILIQERNVALHEKYLDFIKNSFADVVIED